MIRIIVDASVACKWLIKETDSDLAFALKRRGIPLSAPDLLVVECVRALYKRKRESIVTLAEVTKSIAVLRGVILDDPGIKLAPSILAATRAMEISDELGDHHPNDCFYLALAEESSGVMVTADAKLIKRVQGSEWEKFARLLADF